MTAPLIGGLGTAGLVALGAAPPPVSTALPAMSKTAQSYIAHLYDRNLNFKRTLGAATILSKPGLKMTQNGGYQAVTLDLATPIVDKTEIGFMEAGTMSSAFVRSADPDAGDGFAAKCPNGGVAGSYVQSLAPVSRPLQAFAGYEVWARVRVASTASVISMRAGLYDQNAGWVAGQYAELLPNLLSTAYTIVKVASNFLPLPGHSQSFMANLASGSAATTDWWIDQIWLVTPGIRLGDVIRLSEQGDNAGTILFSGNVESMPEEWSDGGTHHQVLVTPWVSELADADFNKNYTVATDVAQFVRDSVMATAHCSVSPVSCPDTGVKGIYNFQNANALDAVHIAKQIAGANYWWHVDPQGLVWLQPVMISSPPTLTIRRGDLSFRKPEQSIVGMRNRIPVVGGSLPGDTTRLLAAQYDGVINQGLYGIRAMNPPPVYPTVTDQTTLNEIAASLGAQYDHIFRTAELQCPALGIRLTLGRPGGVTLRYWESSVDPLRESGQGSGGYSPTLILQDVEVDGPSQRLIVGDTPFADLDSTYEATRIAQRVSVAPMASVIPPIKAPVAVPPSTIVMGHFDLGPTLQAMGAGVVALGSATFTTTKAGTCQVQGQLDCVAVYWDNYIAAPRRAVWMDLPGITTLAKQELLQNQRQTVGDDSGAGIAIPAGTYTVYWYSQFVEYNQLQLYSGWGQVVWTG